MAEHAWHSADAASVAERLRADPGQGLSSAEAAERLCRHGANRLASQPARPLWLKFLDQFRSLLIIVLLGAAVVAGVVGDLKDSLVIVVVALGNAALGFFQEHRAEAALAALKEMLAPSARVRRDGQVCQIDAAELVPGDLLLLEAGDRVPADARIVEAHAAEVAEAALTGEAQAVAKQTAALPADSPLAERSNMLFMNTVVTRGRLEALVTATGMASEMGRLAGLLAAAPEAQTPLQRQLDQLGKRLAAIAGGVVALLFAVGIARGDDLLATALTAIALAVAAIPEGLPAVVTVTLALGMQHMARRHAIVKKLSAVETLGCTTVICTDKTGTLTLNQMTARRLFYRGRRFAVSGEGYAGAGQIEADGCQPPPDWQPLLTPAALCADARLADGQLLGDPTEGALLALCAKGGLDVDALRDASPRLAELPFDAAHKLMATFHRTGDEVHLWLKGAPDVLLGRSANYLAASGEAPLDAAARAAFEAENATLAGQAMRVLAVAGRCIPASEFNANSDLLDYCRELTLLGLVGIVDPPRPEAREAIRLCQQAGIAVKMITGDHRATAAAIAAQLGLAGEVHEGRELEGLAPAAVAALVQRSAVLARVAPEHKMQIVAALQADGEVVAMTGDGVNDAPALKTADIGVAMGITGTEVSKEAADLVLTDDNFASIVGAIKEGRTLYDNIVKFVRFQLTTNIGAILTVLGAALLGFATPFTAIQILWVNIIMDGPPAMTLGLDPARPGIMHAAPRTKSAAILTGRRLLWSLCFGLIMAAGTLAAYTWGLQHADHRHAVTLAFTTFVLFQFFNIFNARAEHGSACNRQLFTNGKLWLALAAVLLMQAVAVHWPPAQTIFGTDDLRLDDWAWTLAIASSALWLEEGRKLGLRAWRRINAT
jgi:Ca2+-transporting ATPase